MKRTKSETGAKSAANVFKAIDNKLKLPGGGCSESIGYMEQSSWMLFLRYLDAREAERRNEAVLLGKKYEPALPKELTWSSWAYPRTKDGTLDTENMLKGDDLIRFVNGTLFPRQLTARPTTSLFTTRTRRRRNRRRSPSARPS